MGTKSFTVVPNLWAGKWTEGYLALGGGTCTEGSGRINGVCTLCTDYNKHLVEIGGNCVHNCGDWGTCGKGMCCSKPSVYAEFAICEIMDDEYVKGCKGIGYDDW